MHENRHYPIYGVRCNTLYRPSAPAGRSRYMMYRLEMRRDWKFMARYRKLLTESIRQARTIGEENVSLICWPFAHDADIIGLGMMRVTLCLPTA